MTRKGIMVHKFLSLTKLGLVKYPKAHFIQRNKTKNKTSPGFSFHNHLVWSKYILSLPGKMLLFQLVTLFLPTAVAWFSPGPLLLQPFSAMSSYPWIHRPKSALYLYWTCPCQRLCSVPVCCVAVFTGRLDDCAHWQGVTYGCSAAT